LWCRYLTAGYDGPIMTPDTDMSSQESTEILEHGFRERLRLVEKAAGFEWLESTP
jgi:hypothetical protein